MKKEDPELTREIISKATTRIRSLLVNDSMLRWEVAKELGSLEETINWSKTVYRSFNAYFCKELSLSPTKVYRYLLVYRLVNKFGYSEKEVEDLLLVISWNAFMNGLSQLKRKVSVEAFISRYTKETTRSDRRTSRQNNPDGDRAYTFSLPAEIANKLDAYLHEYGMTENSYGDRRGVRDAMIKLINYQLV